VLPFKSSGRSALRERKMSRSEDGAIATRSGPTRSGPGAGGGTSRKSERVASPRFEE
jgi:hypothetical protein